MARGETSTNNGFITDADRLSDDIGLGFGTSSRGTEGVKKAGRWIAAGAAAGVLLVAGALGVRAGRSDYRDSLVGPSHMLHLQTLRLRHDIEVEQRLAARFDDGSLKHSTENDLRLVRRGERVQHDLLLIDSARSDLDQALHPGGILAVQQLIGMDIKSHYQELADNRMNRAMPVPDPIALPEIQTP